MADNYLENQYAQYQSRKAAWENAKKQKTTSKQRMTERMKKRRTIRKYTGKDITDDLLNQLLEVAFRASNTGNMQTYSVIITRSKEQKQKLAPAHFNQQMITNAPVVLTFCADFNRFSKWCLQRKAVPGYNNFQSFISAAIDATIVAQTFATAAEEVGLGICYLGTTTYNAASIIEVLQLPKLVVPITTITVGYPDELPSLQDRLPLAGLIHQEKYTDYTDNAIDDIYGAKEALTESTKFIAENQKETLAQVFTDIRYTKENNEFFSTAFINVLKKQGFLTES